MLFPLLQMNLLIKKIKKQRVPEHKNKMWLHKDYPNIYNSVLTVTDYTSRNLM